MTPPLTAGRIAELVGGRLVGAGELVVDGVASLEEAGPSHLSFLSGGRYLEAFRVSQAGLVLVGPAQADAAGPATRVVVADPKAALATVLGLLAPDAAPRPGVDPTARLGHGVELAEGVSIGPGAVLGDRVRLGPRVVIGPGVVLEEEVAIGADSVLGPRVVCGPRTRLGARVVVKAGAVLGTIGFGYHSGPDGHARIPHAGRCVVEDDVHVGANSCIDRGSVGDTVVGAGTKIDNLVQIGHNVRIGRHCLIMAGVGIAGSSRIGDGVVLAGQVGVAGHLTIGDRVRAAAQAGIIGDIPAGTDVTGFPARANREFLRSQAVLYRLVPLVKDLEALVQARRADG